MQLGTVMQKEKNVGCLLFCVHFFSLENKLFKGNGERVTLGNSFDFEIVFEQNEKKS